MGSGASSSKAADESTIKQHVLELLPLMEDSELERTISSLGDIAPLKDVVDKAKGKLEKQRASAMQDQHAQSQLIDDLGGMEKIHAMKTKSQRLIASIDAALGENHRVLEQHLVYEGAGLEKLISDGHKVKPVFDGWGVALCESWLRKFDLQCEFIGASVKSLDRSKVKVRVELNGKTTLLKDVVRGTVKITSPPTPEALENLYDALNNLVDNAATLVPGLRVKVLRLKDRYQCPAGQYVDFMLNVKMKNFICELQVNFAAALEQKNAKHHKQYEFDRMAKGTLLDASMRGDAVAVNVMLSTVSDVRGLKDSNNCTPLTYAAAYGDQEMVSSLLMRGANPFELDASGWFPVHYALSKSLGDVAVIILDQMILALEDVLQAPSDLRMSTAYEEMFGFILTDPTLHFLQEKALEFLNGVKASPDVHCVWAAAAGDVEVCKYNLNDRGCDPTWGLMFNPQSGTRDVSLDLAVSHAGSPEMVQLLAEHGAMFSYDTMHANPQARALQYASRDQAGSLRALLAAERLKVSLYAEDGSAASWGSEGWPGTPLNHHVIAEAAAKNGSRNALRAMVQDGFKLTEPSKSFEDQFASTLGSGDLEFFELLYEAGVSVNSINSSGISMLALASYLGQIGVCKFLISRGADVNHAGGFDHTTPAHEAAVTGRINIIELLHLSRADLKLKNRLGETPLQQAQSNEKPTAAALIQKLIRAEETNP